MGKESVAATESGPAPLAARPHDLLESILRVFAISVLFTIPGYLLGRIDEIRVLTEHGTGNLAPYIGMVWLMGIVPTLALALLLAFAPRICRWLHVVPHHDTRVESAPARVSILRIGVASMGLYYITEAVFEAIDAVLAASGHGDDAATHARHAALGLATGAVMLFSAHRIARIVDAWSPGVNAPRR